MKKKGLSALFQPVELTQGECWKTILAFSFPIIVSYLLQQVYTISDAAIVGQTLAADEVAGVNDTSPIAFIFLQFAFGVSAGAVERCLRVAVEGVFTMGSIPEIERFFGATIDPDKGKPTNRAFLMEAASQLRLLLDGGMLGEEQGDAPQPCRAYQRIDDAAPDRRLTAEDPRHQIELKYADQRPVDGPDNDQHQCDRVYHKVPSFLQARGLFQEFAPEGEELCSSGRKQA